MRILRTLSSLLSSSILIGLGHKCRALLRYQAVVANLSELNRFERFKSSGRYRTYLRFLRIQQNKPDELNFNTFRVLGKGGFGIVNACRTYTTGRMFISASVRMYHKFEEIPSHEQVCHEEYVQETHHKTQLEGTLCE